jgi:hypothetical protein
MSSETSKSSTSSPNSNGTKTNRNATNNGKSSSNSNTINETGNASTKSVHRKNTRKQNGGGIFTSRIGGPVATILGAVNGFIGDEIQVVRKVVSSIFDAASDAVMGLTRGSNRVVSGLRQAAVGHSRRNNNTRRNSRRNSRKNSRRNRKH